LPGADVNLVFRIAADQDGLRHCQRR
jgi:hypothetical protein